jgi:hypothetical protein
MRRALGFFAKERAQPGDRVVTATRCGIQSLRALPVDGIEMSEIERRIDE